MSFPADATAAMASLQATITAAGTLQGAPVQTLATVAASALAAAKIITADIVALDPLLLVSSPDGSDPTVLAAWLLAAQSNSAQQANLEFANAYVQRIALNAKAAQTQ